MTMNWIPQPRQLVCRFYRFCLRIIFLAGGAFVVTLTILSFAFAARWATNTHRWLIAQNPYISALLLPFGLVAILYLTKHFAPQTAGSGVPQVIASIHQPERSALFLAHTTLLKIPLTALGMLCGASIGRQGPSIHVGAAVMFAWHRLWHSKLISEQQCLLIGAGCGLATAFNAPLAGIVFILEELGRAKTLRWRQLECVFLTIALAAGFYGFFIDFAPYFPQFSAAKIIDNAFFGALVCALVCGVGGGLFALVLGRGKNFLFPESWRTFFCRHPYFWAFFCGVVLTVLGLFYQGQTYGSGEFLIPQLLTPEYDDAPTLALGKWLASVVSYWVGIAGGIFVPCLSTGAVIGKTLAQIGQITAAAPWILCGMAAFLAAATQSPLTAAVVVMEMTGCPANFVYLLPSCLVANLISRRIFPVPFYHFCAARL